MTDTLWADVSEFQPVANNTYPFRWLSFRSNDGTYRDRHFAANYEWAQNAVAAGRLDAFIVYFVYRPDGGNCASTLMSMVGTPNPRMAVMIDVESWKGSISGDHSADIDLQRSRIAKWLGSDKRVIGYGNVGDLRNIWPHDDDTQLVIAAYGTNPNYPGKLAHQYADNAHVAPFGTCDINSADGYSSAALAAALGLTVTLASAQAPVTKPAPRPPLVGHNASSWTTAQIQSALNKVAGDHLVVDGKYGPATTAAVHAFEVAHKLSVDIGIAGPQVVAELEKLMPKPNPKTNLPHLKIDGVEGPLTTEAEQRALVVHVDGIRGPVTISHEQRLTGAHVDGIDGPDTARHLQEWLNAHTRAGLKVDGIRGPMTVRALQRSLDAGTFHG